MNNKMNRSQKLDDYLDAYPWEREVTVMDLESVALPDGDDGGGLLAVQEPSSVRPMTYRIFNLLTLTSHQPRAVATFLREEYERQFNIAGAHVPDQSSEWYRILDGEIALRRTGLLKIAEVLTLIENEDFDDVGRYWVRPHARVLRMNYNEFPALEVGPTWPGRQILYRGSGNPTRLVPINEHSADAMEW